MTKKLSTFLFLTSLCFAAMADNITEVSEPQAQKLAAMLLEQKYLYLYCDCCDNKQGQWVEVEQAKVEPSTANEGASVVRVKGIKTLAWDTDANGNFLAAHSLNEPYDELVPINNSMLPKSGRGFPVGYFLGISPEKIGSCMEFIYYPEAQDKQLWGADAANLAAVKSYQLWYKQKIYPHLSKTDFVGSWDVINICPDARSDCKGLPPGTKSAKLNIEATGKVNLQVDEDANRGTWKIANGKIIITDESKSEIVYGYYQEGKTLILRNMERLKAGQAGGGEMNYLKLKKMQ